MMSLYHARDTNIIFKTHHKSPKRVKTLFRWTQAITATSPCNNEVIYIYICTGSHKNDHKITPQSHSTNPIPLLHCYKHLQ
jgi:hypothetical protein